MPIYRRDSPFWGFICYRFMHKMFLLSNTFPEMDVTWQKSGSVFFDFIKYKFHHLLIWIFGQNDIIYWITTCLTFWKTFAFILETSLNSDNRKNYLQKFTYHRQSHVFRLFWCYMHQPSSFEEFWLVTRESDRTFLESQWLELKLKLLFIISFKKYYKS